MANAGQQSASNINPQQRIAMTEKSQCGWSMLYYSCVSLQRTSFNYNQVDQPNRRFVNCHQAILSSGMNLTIIYTHTYILFISA